MRSRPMPSGGRARRSSGATAPASRSATSASPKTAIGTPRPASRPISWSAPTGSSSSTRDSGARSPALSRRSGATALHTIERVGWPRCHFVYAVAPDDMSASEANDVFNAFLEGSGRGLPVFHDHFTGEPHGGIAVFEVRDDDEEAALTDPAPLAGWRVAVHPLTFSLSGV